MLLHEAFRDHGAEFRFDFNQFYRFFGDCKVIHTSGVELFIECKVAHCRVNASLYMDHLQCERGEKRDIFSWKAQWDFLFTLVGLQKKAGNLHGFLIPRDVIPHEW